MKFLIRFINEYHDFRIPEFENAALAEDIKIKYSQKLEKGVFNFFK